MYENTADLLKQITLGEDSALELKTTQRSQVRLIRFDKQTVPGTIPNTMTLESISERQSSRNELISSLLARCPMNVEAPGSRRSFIMDRRGEGVPIIITESEALSGRRPEYALLDDAEVKLTIFAAEPPRQEDLPKGGSRFG